MVRVLQVVTYMGRGGLETMLMNYYRHMDRNRVQFDFLVHRPFEADYDAEIRALGGKIYRVSRLIPWSRTYRAELRNFFCAHPDYRIVHVHQDCLSAVALQCARDCGVPVRIAHSHNSSQTRNIKYPIKCYYMKQIPAAATHLFACGRQAGDWMFGGSPYQVIPNAIEVPKYRYDPQLARWAMWAMPTRRRITRFCWRFLRRCAKSGRMPECFWWAAERNAFGQRPAALAWRTRCCLPVCARMCPGCFRRWMCLRFHRCMKGLALS